MRFPLLVTGSAVGLLIALGGCGSSDDVPSNGVAMVGGTVITRADFQKQLERAAQGESNGGTPIPYDPPDFEKCVTAKDKANAAPEGGNEKSADALRTECEDAYERLRIQAMEFLIQREWVDRAAEKRGVKVTPAQVRAEFERQKDQAFKTEKEYKEFLLSSGRSERDILAEVNTNLRQRRVSEKVVAGKVKVTNAEIKAYYAQNRKQLGKPERRDVRVVIAKSEGLAQQAKDALAQGAGWATVANEYSIDKASSSKGGRLVDVSNTGDKQIDADLKHADVGAVQGPTKTQFGWWIFEVEKVLPASIPVLKDVRPQVANAVRAQEQQRLLDDFAQRFREEYRRKTVCADDFKVASCRNGPATNPTMPAKSMQQPQQQN